MPRDSRQYFLDKIGSRIPRDGNPYAYLDPILGTGGPHSGHNTPGPAATPPPPVSAGTPPPPTEQPPADTATGEPAGGTPKGKPTLPAGGGWGGGVGPMAYGGSRGFSGGGANVDPRVAEILLNQGALPQLDEATLAELAKSRTAALEQADYVYDRDKAALMEDLWGRGMNRSTVAGDAGDRMLGQRAAILAQIEADAANRGISLREGIAGRQLQGASAYGDLSVRQNATAAQERVGMAEVGAKHAQIGAQMKIAQMEDSTRRYLGEGDLDIRKGDLGLRQDELSFRKEAFEKELEFNKYQYKDSKPKWWERVISAATSIFSSIEFKDVVDPEPNTADALEEITKVPLFRWNYKGEERVRLGPVIEASSEAFSADGMTLDIANILGLLIGAVQEQQKMINELKGDN